MSSCQKYKLNLRCKVRVNILHVIEIKNILTQNQYFVRFYFNYTVNNDLKRIDYLRKQTVGDRAD